MVLRLALFALIGLAIAGFGAFAWISMHPAAAPEPVADAPAPPPEISILVSASPLRAGGLLRPEDMTAQSVPAAGAPAGARLDTPAARSELTGAMVRRSLTRGEPLLPADVLRPGDHGFLAAVLGPGMRAATVGVDAVTGSAGLIWPGDRVDLILTQAQDDQTLPAGKRVSAETVLSDVRVIAIDQQMMQGATGAPDSQVARTATLEVSPAQAEQVAVAARLGRLSLAVRAAMPDPSAAGAGGGSAAAGKTVAGPDTKAARAPVTWGGDVSAALDQGHRGTGNTVLLFRGPEDGKEIHF